MNRFSYDIYSQLSRRIFWPTLLFSFSGGAPSFIHFPHAVWIVAHFKTYSYIKIVEKCIGRSSTTGTGLLQRSKRKFWMTMHKYLIPVYQCLAMNNPFWRISAAQLLCALVGVLFPTHESTLKGSGMKKVFNSFSCLTLKTCKTKKCIKNLEQMNQDKITNRSYTSHASFCG